MDKYLDHEEFKLQIAVKKQIESGQISEEELEPTPETDKPLMHYKPA